MIQSIGIAGIGIIIVGLFQTQLISQYRRDNIIMDRFNINGVVR